MYINSLTATMPNGQIFSCTQRKRRARTCFSNARKFKSAAPTRLSSSNCQQNKNFETNFFWVTKFFQTIMAFGQYNKTIIPDNEENSTAGSSSFSSWNQLLASQPRKRALGRVKTMVVSSIYLICIPFNLY